jgi:hypothetical protein
MCLRHVGGQGAPWPSTYVLGNAMHGGVFWGFSLEKLLGVELGKHRTTMKPRSLPLSGDDEGCRHVLDFRSSGASS